MAFNTPLYMLDERTGTAVPFPPSKNDILNGHKAAIENVNPQPAGWMYVPSRDEFLPMSANEVKIVHDYNVHTAHVSSKVALPANAFDAVLEALTNSLDTLMGATVMTASVASDAEEQILAHGYAAVDNRANNSMLKLMDAIDLIESAHADISTLKSHL